MKLCIYVWNPKEAGIHVAVWDKPVLDPGKVFSVTIHCAPGRWLIHSLAMLAVANLNWFLREFGTPWEKEAREKNVSVFEVCDGDVKQTPSWGYGDNLFTLPSRRTFTLH